MGQNACSHVALSLRIIFSVSPELLSPREIQCSALVVKEDVVIMLMWVGSSECATSTVLNGHCLRKSLACCAWIPWVTTVSQFLVATKRSMLVASLSLSMLVVRDAHSACNHCASLLSLRFSRQPLFSMDITGQPTNRGANSLVHPSGFPRSPENLSLPCGSSTTVRTKRRPTHGVVSSAATVDVCLGFAVDLCLMFSHRSSR